MLEKHDHVRLIRDTDTDQGLIPAGAEGAIVHVGDGHAAFIIEFTNPVHVATTVPADAVVWVDPDNPPIPPNAVMVPWRPFILERIAAHRAKRRAKDKED
jgi:hypothetical protein